MITLIQVADRAGDSGASPEGAGRRRARRFGRAPYNVVRPEGRP
ncbi:hypothetical protein [Actinomadura flavalba]|nr:hypothetical protein [Actinomadura flavalba]